MVFVYSINGMFVVINWKDKKHVLMLSTNLSITNQMGTCKRNTVDAKHRHEKFEMARPKMVEDYSNKMFFIDLKT